MTWMTRRTTAHADTAARARATLLVWTALVVSAAGTPTCASPGKVGFDSGLPGMRTSMTVTRVTRRGPYLEIGLTLGDDELEAYVADGDECRKVFSVSESVRYLENGPLGVYLRGEEGEERCQSLGVGNLRLWRDRNSRSAGDSASVVPRAQARFRVIHRDDEVVLLRGRFPQAVRLGFTGPIDLVAVVPVTAECEGPIETGVASLEYRTKGSRVLSLVGQRGLCEIRGLAQPPSQTEPTPAD